MQGGKSGYLKQSNMTIISGALTLSVIINEVEGQKPRGRIMK